MAEFYSARSWEIPPLPWTNLSPPFSRMIDKWLKAGVLEEDALHRPVAGTPQGGVISPMLSNVYLHHVLDEWFENVAKPRLHGRCQLVRFADDFVIALEDRHSGKRMLDVLGKRLGRYGLTLHETKTRYVDFRRRRPYGRHWMASATTFDFLGFTHVWGRSMQGKDVVRQITAKGRFARALKSVHDWCKRHRHLPIEAQRDHLAKVIRGHCAYYGLTGNGKRLGWFRYQVVRIWRKWLARRSRLRCLNWDRMAVILKRLPLPPVTFTRSWQSTLRLLNNPRNSGLHAKSGHAVVPPIAWRSRLQDAC